MGRARSIVANGQGGPFDLIDGLPVHPLVVHGAVVLIPLAALGVLLMAAWPRFSRRHGWLVLAVAVVAPGAAVVSVRSGEALEERVGEPGFDHAELGEVLPLFAGALLVATLALWLVDRWRGRAAPTSPDGEAVAPARGGLLRVLVALLAVVVAVGNLVWVYRVGHSGAQSVWLDEVDGEVDVETVVPAATFTTDEVAQRDDASACWSIVGDVVYDLTEWIERHPGGQAPIETLCGRDGTVLFTAQHEGQEEPAEELAEYAIGRLG